MEDRDNSTWNPEEEAQYNMSKGVIAAVLMAVLCALVYGLISHLTGYIFWYAGFLIGFAVYWAYTKFDGKPGAAGAVIAVVLTVLSIFLAYTGDLVFTAYRDIRNSLNPNVKLGPVINYLWSLYQTNPEVNGEINRNLLLSLGTGVIGAVVAVVNRQKTKKPLGIDAVQSGENREVQQSADTDAAQSDEKKEAKQ